ncbi:hypothetical protein ACJJTC_001215 [Scirpophaga incertulas]
MAREEDRDELEPEPGPSNARTEENEASPAGDARLGGVRKRIFFISALPSTSGQTPSSDRANTCEEVDDPQLYIRQNRDRLLYYIEETNEGKGFIKELCYSADGRLVCSPFGRGMRLLAINQECSELSQCARELRGARPMVDVGQCLGIHQDLVVCSKFNPRYHMLVTGCLEGKIVWYEPYSGEALY